MPRGDNPNSRANLAKSKGFTTETARKASKKALETKRAYASLTEALKAQVGPDEMAELTLMLYKRAKAGNLKAYELLRDQLGEKPVEKVSVSAVDTEAIDKLKAELEKRRADNGKSDG